jgi:hypothetical protein
VCSSDLAIATGLKGGLEVPFTCTITAARIVSMDNTSGAIAINVWKAAYSGCPPVVGGSIGSYSIAASGVKSESTGLSIALTAGNWLAFNVDSATSVKLVTLSLTVSRTL